MMMFIGVSKQTNWTLRTDIKQPWEFPEQKGEKTQNNESNHQQQEISTYQRRDKFI